MNILPLQTNVLTLSDTSRGRATAAPESERFRAALESGASRAMDGAGGIAELLPGGTAVSAAVRGLSPDGADPLGGLLQTQAGENMKFLELQAAVSAENQRFTTLSNVMKARHETAKTAIGNIR